MAMQLNTMMQMKCNQYATLYVILANNVCGKYKETSTTKRLTEILFVILWYENMRDKIHK